MARPRALLSLALATALTWGGDRAWGGVTETSYRQALDTIHQSLKAMGAQDWPQNSTPVLIEAAGTRDLAAEHRGRAPTESRKLDFRETWAWDPVSNRVGREYRLMHADGTVEWVREIFPEPGRRLTLTPGQDSVVESRGAPATASRDRNLRRFPPLLLFEALEQAASLRASGHFGPFESVQIQTREQETLSLFFGRESRLLGMVEYLADLPTFSDTTVSWTFSDYRPGVGGLSLPHRYSVRIGDRMLADMEVRRISANPDEVEAFLDAPPSDWRWTHRAEHSGEDLVSAARVEDLGAGAYRIVDLRPGFHFLFVEFDNFVLAVDAPSNEPRLMELPAGSSTPGLSEAALSQRALDLIRDTLPGKPVTHLALTHFHSEHAGGLLAFSDRRVDLHAPRKDRSAIEAFLQRSHTLCGDDTHDHHAFTLRPVASRATIEDDGGQVVHLVSAESSPHAAQTLLVWLPGSELLWVPRLEDTEPDAVGASWLTQWLQNHTDIRPQRVLRAHGASIDPPAWVRFDAQQTLQSPRDP